MQSAAPTQSVSSRLLDDLSREHGFEPLRVQGQIPKDLRGTLYRTGPALFSTFGRPYRHWFDGDGAVIAVRFNGAGDSECGVQGAVRIVESAGLVAERHARRPLYTAGATPAPTWHRRVFAPPKNMANTNVLAYDGRLFALYEAGLPTELTGDALRTLGECDLGGVIKQRFSAHYHAVAARQAVYNFGLEFGRQTRVHCYELKAGAARQLGAFDLPMPLAFIHDFMATTRHLIFFIHPVRIHPLKMMLGLGSLDDCIEWAPQQGSEVVVVPIDDPARVVRFSVDAFFQWHFVNAFERQDEIVIDVLRTEDFGSYAALEMAAIKDGQLMLEWPARLHRAVVSPARKSLQMEQRSDRGLEFGRVAPAVCGSAYRYAYAQAAAPSAALLDRLIKFDSESGRIAELPLERGHYPSEPIFVPRDGASAEDDGYVLSLVYEPTTHQSYVAIFDAQRPEAPPIGKAWFNHHIPPTFHGTFATAAR